VTIAVTMCIPMRWPGFIKRCSFDECDKIGIYYDFERKNLYCREHFKSLSRSS